MNSSWADRRPTLWARVEHAPLDANLPALLDRAVAHHPERLFWQSIDGDAPPLRYAEFGRLSRLCAEGLHARGVRKGSHVALMLPNSAGFMLCWMALCRLGAVAVMVNTASTSAEVERMLTTADVLFIVIDREFLPAYEGIASDRRLPEGHVIVHGTADGVPLAVDQVPWDALVSGTETGQRLPEVMPDDIASIQFTSGSSGVPKACMLSHRYWLTLGKSRLSMGPEAQRMLIDSPMFYMGPLWRVIVAIHVGATLFVAKRYSLSRLFDRILEHKIDFCSVTYPVAKLEEDPRIAHSALKFVTTYGLSKELHAGLERRLGVPVREIYGMTEVGSVLCMPVEDTSMVGSGSCGLPAPFRRCKVVAEGGADAPAGVAGELWVAGPGIFSGYYKDPEATARSFEGEWFKTGDLFMRDENGYHYMLGRIKDVIRRSGENISASEIELTVNAIDGVLEVAAIPVADALRGEEVQVVVARAPGEAGRRLSAEAIVQACQAALSPFKVPRYVQFVDVLPKTPTGKIDKNVLKRGAYGADAAVHDARPDKKRSV
ncbi:class I adenylate-forming enzyme family protein [Variovorax boronicumulans]|uniref:class I adenylate-forming enzyme family protein n=1 Tax=Variovorax boronicumulans TaxID=436515 RepID=UPI001C5947E0